MKLFSRQGHWGIFLIEQRADLLCNWLRLSYDGLEQKACVLEDFKTKADDFFVAHNDRLAPLNRRCQLVYMRAYKHTSAVL